MARQAMTVLPFPMLVPDPAQLSAFPFASSATVLQHLAHAVLHVTRLRDVLSPNHCLLLLGEISLLLRALDVIELDCKRTVERNARSVGLLP